METDIVFISGPNNEPMVSSRMVAERFDKEHNHVLRDVRQKIMPFISEQFNASNFALVEYIDAKGEKRPEIMMTKNGFVLLAMGFTGEEAMLWKIRFIDAFDSALGSISELREELARKEAVILKLQGKTKKERRWLVPSYENQLPGFPTEPRMVLKPQAEIKQPELNIAKYNHLKRTIEGIERQMLALKKEIGMV
jgi:Rha family phage regulatory protein